MNNVSENQMERKEPEYTKERELIFENNAEKGDIDDYIFSWQTIKMVSER